MQSTILFLKEQTKCLFNDKNLCIFLRSFSTDTTSSIVKIYADLCYSDTPRTKIILKAPEAWGQDIETGLIKPWFMLTRAQMNIQDRLQAQRVSYYKVYISSQIASLIIDSVFSRNVV